MDRIYSFINKVIILFTLLILSGCGYFKAGTWENDPQNWHRVYGFDPPDHVQIINSYYWRSAHFTLEFEFYFEIAPNNEVLETFLSDESLRKVKPQNEWIDFFQTKPEWFIPKDIKHYEVWIAKDSGDNFKLFVDKDTGHIFWTQYQV